MRGAIDADTLVVDVRDRLERVQMIGVDAPESASLYVPAECFGRESAEATAERAGTGLVWLEFDATQGQRNGLGDLQAYVWLPDGALLNQWLIEQGLAREHAQGTSSYKYQGRFRTVAAQARDRGAGLWAPGACVEVTHSTPLPKPTGEDPDCADFVTWADAQQFFLQQGGPAADPYRLDADRDGVACNSLRAQE
jgi:micrococcal nuclease